MDLASVAAPVVAAGVASFLATFQRKTAPSAGPQTGGRPSVPLNNLPNVGPTVPLGQAIDALWLDPPESTVGFSWPLASQQNNPGTSTVSTFQGQTQQSQADIGPNPVNPFDTYQALGGLNKYILNARTATTCTLALRTSTTSTFNPVPDFALWLTCTAGNAVVTTNVQDPKNPNQNSQFVKIAKANTARNATQLCFLQSNVSGNGVGNPTVTIQTLTPNTLVEFFVATYDSTQTALKVSTVIAPQLTNPILNLQDSQAAKFSSSPLAGFDTVQSSTITANVPTGTLQCDSDLYDFCVNWTLQNAQLENSLRVDSLVKPTFLRVDLQQPLSVQETMVHSGPFVTDAQELTLAYNGTDTSGSVQVPLKFAKDLVQFFNSVYQPNDTEAQGLRKQEPKASAVREGPVKLSVTDLENIFIQSGKPNQSGNPIQNDGLRCEQVRNDTEKTLSLIVTVTGDSAPFWMSPTCSQFTGMQAQIFGETAGFGVSGPSGLPAPLQYQMNSEELSFRSPPQTFLDSKVPSGTQELPSNNWLPLYAQSSEISRANGGTGADNNQQTPQQSTYSLKPVAFPIPKVTPNIYPQLSQVAQQVSQDISTWASTGSLSGTESPNNVLFNNRFIAGANLDPLQVTIGEDLANIPGSSNTWTEKIRLHFASNSDPAGHGLWGLSFAADPYLGASLTGSSAIVNLTQTNESGDLVSGTNRYQSHTNVMQSSASTLGFQLDNPPTEAKFVVQPNVNDLIVVSYRATAGLPPDQYTGSFAQTLGLARPKVYSNVELSQALTDIVQDIQNTSIASGTSGTFNIQVTQTPNAQVYDGYYRLQLSQMTGMPNLSTQVGLEYRQDQLSGTLGSIDQAQLRASGRLLGLPVGTEDLDGFGPSDQQVFLNEPNADNLNQLITGQVPRNVGPFRMYNPPMAYVTIETGQNDILEWSPQGTPGVGTTATIPAGYYNAIEFGDAVNQIFVNNGLGAIEARNQYNTGLMNEGPTAGLSSDQIFGSLWWLCFTGSSNDCLQESAVDQSLWTGATVVAVGSNVSASPGSLTLAMYSTDFGQTFTGCTGDAFVQSPGPDQPSQSNNIYFFPTESQFVALGQKDQASTGYAAPLLMTSSTGQSFSEVANNNLSTFFNFFGGTAYTVPQSPTNFALDSLALQKTNSNFSYVIAGSPTGPNGQAGPTSVPLAYCTASNLQLWTACNLSGPLQSMGQQYITGPYNNVIQNTGEQKFQASLWNPLPQGTVPQTQVFGFSQTGDISTQGFPNCQTNAVFRDWITGTNMDEPPFLYTGMIPVDVVNCGQFYLWACQSGITASDSATEPIIQWSSAANPTGLVSTNIQTNQNGLFGKAVAMFTGPGNSPEQYAMVWDRNPANPSGLQQNQLWKATSGPSSGPWNSWTDISQDNLGTTGFGSVCQVTGTPVLSGATGIQLAESLAAGMNGNVPSMAMCGASLGYGDIPIAYQSSTTGWTSVVYPGYEFGRVKQFHVSNTDYWIFLGKEGQLSTLNAGTGTLLQTTDLTSPTSAWTAHSFDILTVSDIDQDGASWVMVGVTGNQGGPWTTSNGIQQGPDLDSLSSSGVTLASAPIQDPTDVHWNASTQQWLIASQRTQNSATQIPVLWSSTDALSWYPLDTSSVQPTGSIVIPNATGLGPTLLTELATPSSNQWMDIGIYMYESTTGIQFEQVDALTGNAVTGSQYLGNFALIDPQITNVSAIGVAAGPTSTTLQYLSGSQLYTSQPIESWNSQIALGASQASQSKLSQTSSQMSKNLYSLKIGQSGSGTGLFATQEVLIGPTGWQFDFQPSSADLQLPQYLSGTSFENNIGLFQQGLTGYNILSNFESYTGGLLVFQTGPSNPSFDFSVVTVPNGTQGTGPLLNTTLIQMNAMAEFNQQQSIAKNVTGNWFPSAMTLGLDPCNFECFALSGTSEYFPLPLGCYINDPENRPAIQVPYDFVPFHATLGAQQVPAALPLFLEVELTQPTDLQQQTFAATAATSSTGRVQKIKSFSGNPVNVPQAFVDDILSALIGPPETLLTGLTGGIPILRQLTEGLLQNPIVLGQTPPSTEPGVLRDSLLKTILTDPQGNYLSRLQLQDALFNSTQAFQDDGALSNQPILRYRFAGIAADGSPNARPFGVDLTQVEGQPYSLVPSNAATNPVQVYPGPLPDSRNLFLYSIYGNSSFTGSPVDQVGGQPRSVLPSILGTLPDTLTGSLASVCVQSDVDLTCKSRRAFQTLDLWTTVDELLPQKPELSIAGYASTNTKTSEMTTVLDIVTPVGVPNETALGGIFSITLNWTQQGTHWVEAKVIAFETNIEDPQNMELAIQEWTSDSNVIQLIDFNANATEVRPVTIQVPVPQTNITSTTRFRIQVSAQCSELPIQNVSGALLDNDPQVIVFTNYDSTAFFQNPPSVLPTGLDLTSFPKEDQWSKVVTPIGPPLVGRSILDTAFGTVVNPEPRLWKPQDSSLGPALAYATEQDSLWQATGTFQGTDLSLDPQALKPLSVVDFVTGGSTADISQRQITNVDVSPGALLSGTNNSGALHDKPVLWFHGATSGTGLPAIQVSLGSSSNQVNNGLAPLNALGYRGQNPVTFRTDVQGATASGISFGVFPDVPALWVEGNLTLDHTEAYEGVLSNFADGGLLGTTGDFLQSEFNLQATGTTGISFEGRPDPSQTPVVPNGLINGLPLELADRDTAFGNNINANNNAFVLLFPNDYKLVEVPVGTYSYSDIAKAIQSLINEQLQIRFNSASPLRVGLIELGSVTSMTFAIVDPVLVNRSTGLCAFSIAGLNTLPAGLSNIDNLRVTNGLNVFGFVDGIQFQLQDQIGGPMILYEKQVTRILVAKGLNDSVTILVQPTTNVLSRTAFPAIVAPGIQGPQSLADALTVAINDAIDAQWSSFVRSQIATKASCFFLGGTLTSNAVKTNNSIVQSSDAAGSSFFQSSAGSFPIQSLTKQGTQIFALAQLPKSVEILESTNEGLEFHPLISNVSSTQAVDLASTNIQLQDTSTFFTVASHDKVQSTSIANPLLFAEVPQTSQGSPWTPPQGNFSTALAQVTRSDGTLIRQWSSQSPDTANVSLSVGHSPAGVTAQLEFIICMVALPTSVAEGAFFVATTNSCYIQQIENNKTVFSPTHKFVNTFLDTQSHTYKSSQSSAQNEVLFAAITESNTLEAFTIDLTSFVANKTAALNVTTINGPSVTPNANTTVQFFQTVDNAPLLVPQYFITINGQVWSTSSLSLAFSQLIDPNLAIFEDITSQTPIQKQVLAVPDFVDVPKPRVIVLSVPRQLNAVNPIKQPFLQFVVKHESPSTFGTLGITFDYDVIQSLIANPQSSDQVSNAFKDFAASRVSFGQSAMTQGFSTRGRSATLFLTSPALAPFPIQMPAGNNETVIFATTGPSIQEAQETDVFYNVGPTQVEFGLDAMTTVFTTGATGPQGTTVDINTWFTGPQQKQADNLVNASGPGGHYLVWEPAVTTQFDDLSRVNLEAQQSLFFATGASAAINGLFTMPVSLFELELATQDIGTGHKGPTADPQPNPNASNAILSTGLFFFDPGLTSLSMDYLLTQVYTGPTADLIGLDFFTIGAGGGSAYGIGGNGGFLKGTIAYNLTGITGGTEGPSGPDYLQRLENFWSTGTILNIMVGEGGSVPHGLRNLSGSTGPNTYENIPASIGGGGSAVWPGSAGGGSSQILALNANPTGLTGVQDWLEIIAQSPGGGGAGCFDLTPGTHTPGSRVSIGGIASNFKGKNANSFTPSSKDTSGGRSGTISGLAGTTVDELPEEAQNNFGNGQVFQNWTDAQALMGGHSIRGGGGGGGGFTGGGAGCAIVSVPKSSTGGGAGSFEVTTLAEQVQSVQGISKNNYNGLPRNILVDQQSAHQLDYHAEDLPVGQFKDSLQASTWFGSSGQQNPNNSNFFVDLTGTSQNLPGFTGELWREAKGRNGAVALVLKWWGPQSILYGVGGAEGLIGGASDGQVYQSLDAGRTWNPTGLASSLNTCTTISINQSPQSSSDATVVVAGQVSPQTTLADIIYVTNNSGTTPVTVGSASKAYDSVFNRANGLPTFVVVGESNSPVYPQVTYSVDNGISWTDQPNLGDIQSAGSGLEKVFAICSPSNLGDFYLLVGLHTIGSPITVYKSTTPDISSCNWISTTSFSNSAVFYNVFAGNRQFIAVGEVSLIPSGVGGFCIVSTNGSQWTTPADIISIQAAFQTVYGVTENAGRIVLVGESSANEPVILYSDDQLTTTLVADVSLLDCTRISNVQYSQAQSLFFASCAGGSTTFAWSSNGIHWKPQTSISPTVFAGLSVISNIG